MVSGIARKRDTVEIVNYGGGREEGRGGDGRRITLIRYDNER